MKNITDNIKENIKENNFTLSYDRKILYEFTNDNNLKTVTIPNTVIEISNDCFSNTSINNTSIIEEIIFPENITTIKKGAFKNCENIKEITLPNNIKIIEDHAFYRCSNLEKVTVPSSIEAIGRHAFSECESLKNFNFTSNEFNKISKISENCFSDCISLEYINLPKSIYIIENYAFSECRSLKEINIPTGVKNINVGVFYKCKNLENIIFSSDLKKISHVAFFNCSSIKELDLSLNSKLETIGSNAFSDCSFLSKVILPDTLEVIENNAFSNCKELSSFNIPNQLKILGNEIFIDCHNIKGAFSNITLPKSIEVIGLETYDFFNNGDIVKVSENIQELNIGINNKVTYWEMYENTKLQFQPFAKVSNISFTVKSFKKEADIFTISFTKDQQYRAVSKIFTMDWSSDTYSVFNEVSNLFTRIENIENNYSIVKAYCEYRNFYKLHYNKTIEFTVFDDFILDNFLDIFEFYMINDDISIISILGSSGFIDEDNIDDCFDLSDDNDKSEFSAYLLNWSKTWN